MATSTELLRAAEHMRQRCMSTFADKVLSRAFYESAQMLESEAGRLQAVEAQQPKRSWPEGWPPFSVLRSAYDALEVHHAPSTRWCDRGSPVVARRTRERWKQALERLKCTSSP